MAARNERELLELTSARPLPNDGPEPDLDLPARDEMRRLHDALENRGNAARRTAAARAVRFWRSLPSSHQGRYVRLLSGVWRCHILSSRPGRALDFGKALLSLAARTGRPAIQAEGLIAVGLAQLSGSGPRDAVSSFELARALFISTQENAIDAIRVAPLLADSYRLTGNRMGALVVLEGARDSCLEMEEVDLLSSVSLALGNLYLETGDLRSAHRCFDFVIKSSRALGSSKRGVRGNLGLGLTRIRSGRLEEARDIVIPVLKRATESQLPRETALAHEYLGEIALAEGSWNRAFRCFRKAHAYAASYASCSEMLIELHHRLAALWISRGETHHASLHVERGLAMAASGGEAEDILALRRARAELAWLQGDGRGALDALVRHEHRVRSEKFGYEQLLTALRIVTVAEGLGEAELAREWWNRSRFLAESCGAERLLERWRVRRDEARQSGALLSGADDEVAPSRLASELPGVDLASHGIITRSRRLQEQAAWIGKLAPTGVPILLLGESGTGKELFAMLVHELSDRRHEVFHALNCGALPGELIESELFGHRRGSFTGAITDKPGLFRAAHRGTIFLDEIGELPASAQAKLLRVLESGEFRPVGETRTERVDVRIVAATNVDLEKAVTRGRFRRDLYFRLKGLEIELPPLRDRLSDIPVLAEHFLDQTNRTLGKTLDLPFRTVQWLMGQPWQGNVRELKLAVERAAALAPDSGPLREYHFASQGQTGQRSLPHELEEIERARVLNALEASSWNVSAAAELLGMSRTTLSGRIRKLGLKRPRRT